MAFYLRRRPRFLRGPYVESRLDAPVLRTDRLVLRPHRMADEEDWFSLVNRPEVRRYLNWPERTRREARRHLKHRTRHTVLWQADDFLALAVELNGRIIGDVSLHLRGVRPESRTVEIGWVLDPRFAGRGYATEAARAMFEFAYERLEAHVVLAIVRRENRSSMALARRLGMVIASQTNADVVFLLTSEGWANSDAEYLPQARHRSSVTAAERRR